MGYDYVAGTFALEFHGRSDHALDRKGRVNIPTRFRKELGGGAKAPLYITNFVVGGQPCLFIYPQREWNKFLGKMQQLSALDPQANKIRTFMIGGAHEVEMDAHGRILVPPDLREFARLVRDVKFSGALDHFELWDSAALEQVLTATGESIKDPNFFLSLNGKV